MKDFPEMVFVNKPSVMRGGGIDYLGLRLVNLSIIGRELLPGLNNVTVDMGMFWLGAWIPWKFEQQVRKENQSELYTEDNYLRFREKIEVAVAASYSLFESRLRNQVGVGQKFKPDAELSFENMKRSASTSIYAAPLYGPAFQYLQLIHTYYSQGIEGSRAVRIPHVATNSQVSKILEYVDAELRKSHGYDALTSLDSTPLSNEQLEDLAQYGLNPALFRDEKFGEGQKCFLELAFPYSSSKDGYKRTLSGKLVVQTITQYPESTANDLRLFWYSGRDYSGNVLEYDGDEILHHAKTWRVLLARQYQRYALEIFLRSFERAILADCRTFKECVQKEATNQKAEGWEGLSLGALFQRIAGDCLADQNHIQTSHNWNQTILAGSERFELPAKVDKEHGVIDALLLMGGWFWRNRILLEEEGLQEFTQLGGAEKVSIKWFYQWLEKRWDKPLEDVLTEIFKDFVFEQHLRTALSREDGKSERIRFHSGDRGLEQSYAKQQNFGRLGLGFTPDRLDTLLALLSDSHVLQEQNGKITLGPNADYFLDKT